MKERKKAKKLQRKNSFLRTVEISKFLEKPVKPAGISLFTGIGGFDIGFQKAGLETRVMVEWNKDCCRTLRANWHWSELRKRQGKYFPLWKNKEEMKKEIDWYMDREPVILEKDICKVTTKEILEAGGFQVGEPFFITGGPPCQGFSMAGKRVIDDPRNKLYREFVRVVREALPKCFVFENVPGLVSMKNGEIILQILEDFANCGYQIAWDLLNAADYGVPQHRVRVFIIGKRNDIAFMPAEGNLQYHIGAFPGPIRHPEKFRKKHNLPDTQ